MLKGILAVGMANIARTDARAQSLKVTAQKEYAQALTCTNAAISSPTHATDDTTLTAILCLSLFEVRISYYFILFLLSFEADSRSRF